MKQIVYYIIAIAIGIVIGVFLIPRQVEVRTETLYDTTTVTVTEENPIPYYITDTIIRLDTVYLTEENDIDTTAILAEFWRYRFYSDTILSNEIEVKFDAEVSRNRIIRYNHDITNRRPIMQVNRYALPRKVGASVIMYYSPDYFGIAPGALYDHGRWQVSGYYDPINGAVLVGGSYKFKP